MYLARLGSLFFLGSLGVALLGLCDGQCNLCSVMNSLACVSQTEFQVCIDGTPNGAVTSCPEGYVCSTINATICQPNQAGVIVACDECNVCDFTGTFACTGPQTYALCLGGATPTNLTASCPQGYVCSNDLTDICGDVTMGIVPTCSTSAGETTTSTTTSTTPTSTSTTTVSPIACPAKYCQNLQQYGRFPVGNNGTYSACKQYVFCVLYGGIWRGQLYTCPGQTYFNSTSRLCGSEVPDGC